ncbi:MAG: tetratricopeptide repeat protein [Candidatus Muiribacteriota bacterium]
MDKENLITVAESFFGQKDYEKAIDICLQILEKDKENIPARLLMADSYFFNGHKEGAVELYKEISRLKKDDYAVNYKYGLSLIATEKYKKALKIFEKILKIPNLPAEKIGNVYGELSEIYYLLGNPDKSEENIKKAIEESKDNAVYYQGLAKLQYIKENYDEAEKIFDKIFQSEEDLEVDCILLSLIKIQQKQYGEALKALELVKEGNNHLKAKLIKSFIYFAQEKKSKFIKIVRELFPELEKSKDIILFTENVGTMLLRFDEPLLALKLFELSHKKVNDDEDMARNLLTRAGILYYLNKVKKGDKLSMKVSPENLQKITTAQYFIEGDLLPYAEKILELALKDNYSPEDDIYLLYYYFWKKQNMFDNALECIEKAIKISDNEDYNIEKIEVLWEMGRPDEAGDLAEELVELTDKIAIKAFCFEILGDLHFEYGQFEESARFFEKVIALYQKEDDKVDYYIILKYLETLFNAEKYTDVAKIFDKYPEYSEEREFMLVKARLFAQTGSEEKALEEYGNLIKKYPHFYIPYIDSANILIESREIQAARRMVKTALNIKSLNEEEREFVQQYMDELEKISFEDDEE